MMRLKRRFLQLLAMAAITSACSKAPAPQPADTSPTMVSPVESAPAIAHAPVTTSATRITEYTLPFTNIAKEGTPEDPRIVRWEDGPCGATPYAKVSGIPLDDAALLPDFVVEFDVSGKELHRWGRPYEAIVAGLDGEKLLFRTQDRAYATDVAGNISPIDDTKKDLSEIGKSIDCPTLKGFEDSGYLWCYDVTDSAGQHRRLAWEGPCA